MCVLLTTMVGHSFSCLKHASIDPRLTYAHVEASSMINRHGLTKISMSLIQGWAFCGFPWSLKLNATQII
jgi:hypothetical protein